jgi:hypothetical protein
MIRLRTEIEPSSRTGLRTVNGSLNARMGAASQGQQGAAVVSHHGILKWLIL